MYMPENGSVDIIHTSNKGYGFGNAADEAKRFQTFVAPPHCTGLVEICAKLRRVTGPDFDAPYVQLYATSNGLPTGNALASSSFCEGGIGSGSFDVAWTSFNASGLQPGAIYAIVLGTTPATDPAHVARYEWAVAPVDDRLCFGKWNGSTWVDESGLGNGWMAVGVRDVDNVIDMTHTGTSGYAFGEAGNQLKRYQTFLGRGNQPLVGVDVKLRKAQSGSQSDVMLELFACSGHKPTGSPLAVASIPAARVGSAWTVIHAPLHYPSLTLEHEYALVLSQRNAGQALYEWAVQPSRRNASFGKWNGASWVDESNLGDGWLMAWLMPPHVDTVDILPATVHGYGFGNRSDEIKRYQVIALSQPASVVGVDLQLRRCMGNTQSDVVGELFATTGNRPSGSPLASAVIGACQLGSDWGTVHLPLKTGNLPAGSYALVLGQRVPAPSRYEWAAGPASGSKAFGKWDGTNWIDESGLGGGWSRVWTTAPDSTLDYSHAARNGYGFGNNINEIKRFQTFTAPRAVGAEGAYDLNGIQVKVRRVFGTDQSDLVAELYETHNNLPVGLPRTRAIVPANLVQPDWTIVNLPLCFKCNWLGQGIVSGKKYAVVLSQRSTHIARYEWATAEVSRAQQFGKWDGTDWSDESGCGDGWLRVSLIWRMAPN